MSQSPEKINPNTSARELLHDLIVNWLKEEGYATSTDVPYDKSIYELGVDSLGAATISAELERLTNKKLNPDQMYDLETIDELGAYIDSLPQRTDLLAPSGENDDSDGAAAPVPAAGDDSDTDGGDSRFAYFRRMNKRVNTLKEQDLYFFEPEISEHDGAWVTANGTRMLMLGSYEYLGLLGHPHLKKKAIDTIEEYGTGHHGVRLLAGTTSVHRELESRLASFMGAEDAIVFSSGYVTNLATISTLVGPGDCVIGDRWNHASIIDGCKMSGADFLEFKHNDMASLEECLGRSRHERKLVVVDAVYSMDGDIVDMHAVIKLARAHNALIMVDEAHSLGVLGKTGRGIQEHFNLSPDDIDIKMGTLSKTLAGCGGFVAASEEITTYLRHHARGYIFSGALPAGQTAVAIGALDVIESEPQLVEDLWRNVRHYLGGLHQLGFDTANAITPIVPVMTKTNEITLEMTRICRAEGLLVIPVCYPAVPMDAPRLRTCVSAIHSPENIDFALDVLGRAGKATGLIS